jgi:hypothetical protein
MELRRRLHDPIAKTGAWLKRVLIGHLNYYAVSGNDPSLWWFFAKVRWTWLRALRRRSQRDPVTASTPEPEGGARCVSSARRDLRGGSGETCFPTATIRSVPASSPVHVARRGLRHGGLGQFADPRSEADLRSLPTDQLDDRGSGPAAVPKNANY